MDAEDLVHSAFEKAAEALSLTADQAAQFQVHDQVKILAIYYLAGTTFQGGGGAVGG
jgi:hypothetical protein